MITVVYLCVVLPISLKCKQHACIFWLMASVWDLTSSMRLHVPVLNPHHWQGGSWNARKGLIGTFTREFAVAVSVLVYCDNGVLHTNVIMWLFGMNDVSYAAGRDSSSSCGTEDPQNITTKNTWLRTRKVATRKHSVSNLRSWLYSPWTVYHNFQWPMTSLNHHYKIISASKGHF